MADVKISALPISTIPLTGTEVLPIVQGTTTSQVSVANLTAGRAINGLNLLLNGNNNAFTYSQLFSNAAWAKNSLSISGTLYAAPDGTTTASAIIEDTANASHSVARGPSLTPGSVYTTSIFAIPFGRNRITIYEYSATGAQATFDVSTGAVIGTGGGGSPSASITLVNGFYRCSMTWTAGAATGLSYNIQRNTDTSLTPYTGDGTSGLKIWGAQVELGTAASPYTATTSSAVTTVNSLSIPSGNLNIQRPLATLQTAPTIASAATIAPTAYITFISGTTTINTITAPSPLSTYGGQLTLIPTGLFLTGITGNIAIASTTVVGKALIMTYDATTAKWYPSY